MLDHLPQFWTFVTNISKDGKEKWANEEAVSAKGKDQSWHLGPFELSVHVRARW